VVLADIYKRRRYKRQKVSVELLVVVSEDAGVKTRKTFSRLQLN
jgi:hypothetical protein